MAYYVLCDDDCRYESMTKEQIISAIEQALEQGYISDPDNAVISKIKEIRANAAARFWIGTEAQFNALSPAPTIHNSAVRLGTDGVLYLCTDDTSLVDKESLDAKADKVAGATEGHIAGLDANGNLVDTGGTDFIIASGTSGNWSYRKYNSGIAESWGYFTGTSDSNGYIKFTLTDPFTYLSSPDKVITVGGGAAGSISAQVRYTEKNSTGAQIYLYQGSATSGARGWVFVHVIGRWK